MWNAAKSVHVILICTILFLGHLHSSTVFPPEETEELELQIYETYDSQESDSASLSEDDIVLIGTVLVIIAVPIAPAAGFLYVWANSLAADQPESGTRNSYTADDADAMATTGGDNDDALISVRWSHAEDDLNWAFVVFKLSVGDNVYDCAIDNSQECRIAQDGNDNNLWETGEFLVLSESGTDIAQSGSTTIDLYVTYRGTAVAGTSDVQVA
jgi:hypothetical protein